MAVSKNTVLSALRDFKELQDAANTQKFVAKENGKQLSTNDFTDAYKNKLLSLKNYTLTAATTESLGGIIVGDGLEVKGDGTLNVTLTGGGDSNIIEAISIDGNIQPIVNKVATLSLSDYAKKNEISTGDSNIIEAISIDGKSQTISNKTAQLDLSDYAKKSDVGAGVRVKGSVNSFSNLPTTAVTGDLYNIKTAGGTDGDGVSIKAGDNVVYTADGKWDVMAGFVDLSNYVMRDGNKVLSTNDFTNTDKDKLNGLQNYTLPAATYQSLGGIIPGEGLGMAGDHLNILYGDGLSLSGSNALTVTMVSGETYDVFKGATNSRGGTSGLVPPPTTNDVGKFLRGNGTWSTVSAGNVVVMAGPSSNSVELGSYISNIQGALWYDLIDGKPALRLRYGDHTYNFYKDIEVKTESTAPALVSNVGIEYQLGTTPSTVQGGLWYEVQDGNPVLFVKGKNFKYGYKHDTQTYVGDDSSLISYLPFDTSTINDAMGNTWSITGSAAVVDNPVESGRKALGNDGRLSCSALKGTSYPWTADFWLSVASDASLVTGTGGSQVVSFDGNGRYALISVSNDIRFNIYTTSYPITSSGLKGNRYHIAFVASSEGFYCYCNGEQIASSTSSKINISTDNILMYDYKKYSGVYIDHFRIRKKVVWTGDFTVPDDTEYI